MSRFKYLSRQSALYREAVKCLERLYSEEGLDSVQRAQAEVTSKGIEEILGQDWKYSKAHPAIEKIIGIKRDFWHELRVPGEDHSKLLLKGRKPWAFLTEPYGIGWETLQKLVDFCKQHKLAANIDARLSAHFPGQTVAILVLRDKR